MAFLYGNQPQEQQEPQPGMFGALMNVLGAPGVDALIGGPWGALGKVLYHGTTAANAENIVREGFDLNRFAQGADKLQQIKGFLGRGVYGSPDPQIAEAYSMMAHPFSKEGRGVVRFHIPDEKILDLSTPPAWAPSHQSFARRALSQAINPTTTHEVRPMVKSIRRHAQKRGMAAVNYPEGETVVYDPRAIDYLENMK